MVGSDRSSSSEVLTAIWKCSAVEAAANRRNPEFGSETCAQIVEIEKRFRRIRRGGRHFHLARERSHFQVVNGMVELNGIEPMTS